MVEYIHHIFENPEGKPDRASMQRALELLGDSIAKYDISHCAPCYDALSEILHSIDASADLEVDYLAVWSEFVAEQKCKASCFKCVTPEWKIAITEEKDDDDPEADHHPSGHFL